MSLVWISNICILHFEEKVTFTSVFYTSSRHLSPFQLVLLLFQGQFAFQNFSPAELQYSPPKRQLEGNLSRSPELLKPFCYALIVPYGTHHLSVVAWDKLGNISK